MIQSDYLLLSVGGHYIAYARNEEDGKWYEYDDSWVTAVSEDIVKNKEARHLCTASRSYVTYFYHQAYVLLYVRKAPAKEYERNQILPAIMAFAEEESSSEATDDKVEDKMNIEQNGKLAYYVALAAWFVHSALQG